MIYLLGLSTELLRLIYKNLTPVSIARLSSTCTQLRAISEAIKHENKNIYRRLEKLGVNSNNFLSICRVTSSFVSGSFALQLALGDDYDTYDIDVYTHETNHMNFLHMLSYMKISSDPLEQINIISRTETNYSGISGYPDNLIITDIMMNKVVIQLISPSGYYNIDCYIVGRFTSPHVCNWWTGHSMHIEYPDLVFNRLMTVQIEDEESRIKRFISKYDCDRGFKLCDITISPTPNKSDTTTSLDSFADCTNTLAWYIDVMRYDFSYMVETWSTLYDCMINFPEHYNLITDMKEFILGYCR